MGGSRSVFASRATPCTESAFALFSALHEISLGIRTRPVVQRRNSHAGRIERPRRMSASISRSRSSMPRTATPCVDVRGAEAYGRQTPSETALLWPGIALLSLDHDPSVHPLAGRICFLFTSRKYQNLRAVGNASNDLLALGFIGSSATNTRSVGEAEFKPIQLLEGRVDPLMVGVWPRKLKAERRSPTSSTAMPMAAAISWPIDRGPNAQAAYGSRIFANASKSVAA